MDINLGEFDELEQKPTQQVYMQQHRHPNPQQHHYQVQNQVRICSFKLHKNTIFEKKFFTIFQYFSQIKFFSNWPFSLFFEVLFFVH